jgi:hypothetical protein
LSPAGLDPLQRFPQGVAAAAQAFEPVVENRQPGPVHLHRPRGIVAIVRIVLIQARLQLPYPVDGQAVTEQLGDPADSVDAGLVVIPPAVGGPVGT